VGPLPPQSRTARDPFGRVPVEINTGNKSNPMCAQEPVRCRIVVPSAVVGRVGFGVEREADLRSARLSLHRRPQLVLPT
jgi:hypothetical protein